MLPAVQHHRPISCRWRVFCFGTLRAPNNLPSRDDRTSVTHFSHNISQPVGAGRLTGDTRQSRRMRIALLRIRTGLGAFPVPDARCRCASVSVCALLTLIITHHIMIGMVVRWRDTFCRGTSVVTAAIITVYSDFWEQNSGRVWWVWSSLCMNEYLLCYLLHSHSIEALTYDYDYL